MGILNRAPWIGLAAVLLSCAPVGPYVWADDYLASAEKEPGSGYRIGVGDLISVRVFGHEGISARERVREDGKVSFPFLRDVQAAGFAPQGLAEQIQARLKDYINAPVVTVAVEETRPLTIPVLGEVVRPGQYTLERGAGMLDALASAGGLTDFAHRDRIFVVRRQSAVVRIRSTFAALSTGQGRAAMLRLQPGDCVVVE